MQPRIVHAFTVQSMLAPGLHLALADALKFFGLVVDINKVGGWVAGPVILILMKE